MTALIPVLEVTAVLLIVANQCGRIDHVQLGNRFEGLFTLLDQYLLKKLKGPRSFWPPQLKNLNPCG